MSKQRTENNSPTCLYFVLDLHVKILFLFYILHFNCNLIANDDEAKKLGKNRYDKNLASQKSNYIVIWCFNRFAGVGASTVAKNVQLIEVMLKGF